ncbi:unnamed protein product [Prunus brigantina]
MPNSMREYVHQIGKASRLGEEGATIVFVTNLRLTITTITIDHKTPDPVVSIAFPNLDTVKENEGDLPTSLLVRNLRHNCRPEDLRGPFGQFGPLKDIYMPRDYYTGVEDTNEVIRVLC